MKRPPVNVEDEGLNVAVEPDEDATPRGRMRTPDDEFEDEDGGGETLLATDVPRGAKIPIFEGVKVVYIGPDPHHAPTLRGRILSENVGGQRVEVRGDAGEVFVSIIGGTDVKNATPGGNFTNYDFRARDRAGVKSARRMPMNHRIVEIRDRPYQPVEHGEHLYWFSRRAQDYHIVVAPETRFAAREYIAARERSRKLRQQMVDKTVAPA